MGIDKTVIFELFVAGIGLGFGPCFLFCAPIISSYIFANGFNQKEGLRVTVIFSLGRIIAYSILGLVSVYFINTLGIQGNIFKRVAGILILLILPVYNLGKDNFKFCNILSRISDSKTNISVFAVGLLVGLSPCAPLIGILTYIVCKSKNIFYGSFYGFVFGIGTFFSPLIFLGLFAGLLNKVLVKSQKISLIFKIIANVILVYLGIKLLL
ncbi:MAG: sulfite exporter TauE/SafE family protein [Elusimicrobia bacterium]|nr:sulfite exporter TauE/SafE family protein [Elusimicrobiota bacterium]